MGDPPKVDTKLGGLVDGKGRTRTIATATPPAPAATGDLGREMVGRGAAYAALDSDGDLDVVLTQIAGQPLLLRNDQATGHHWLRVL